MNPYRRSCSKLISENFDGDDANDGDGGDDGDENVDDDDDDDGRLLLWQVMSPTPHALPCFAPLGLSPMLHSCDKY